MCKDKRGSSKETFNKDTDENFVLNFVVRLFFLSCLQLSL